MKGADPVMNTKNTRGKRGKTQGKHKRITKPTQESHTCARSKEHKEIHGPNPTKDDTSGGSSSPREGLESTRDLPTMGVLNPLGESSPKRS